MAITSKGVMNPTSFGHFVLEPSEPGRLKSDSGTESAVWSESFETRNGQSISITDWVTTRKGKRGTFVIRSHIEYVHAGNGYHVGVGTWKAVRGTGAYKGIAGEGRIGSVWRDQGPWFERAEGFLASP